jgi:DNA-binding NarL/FixJ family response regulator
VILADPESLICDMAAQILQPEFEVVAIVRDGRSLVTTATDLQPDVVVCEVLLPLLSGLDAVREIRVSSPATKIVFLSMKDDPLFVTEALAYASGYLLKTSAGSELPSALREVLRGYRYITPQLALKLSAAPHGRAGSLTQRERQVIELLAEGKSMREVAAVLILTPRTVAFHKYRAMKKLGVHSNAELIRLSASGSLGPR